MSEVKSSVSSTVVDVPPPALTISIRKVSWSPEAMVLLSEVLMTRRSAWLPSAVEFTPSVTVLFVRLGSGKLGLTVVTVMELLRFAVPVAVDTVRSVTGGVVVLTASGVVKSRVQVMGAGPITGTAGEHDQPLSAA